MQFLQKILDINFDSTIDEARNADARQNKHMQIIIKKEIHNLIYEWIHDSINGFEPEGLDLYNRSKYLTDYLRTLRMLMIWHQGTTIAFTMTNTYFNALLQKIYTELNLDAQDQDRNLCNNFTMYFQTNFLSVIN